MAAWEHSSPANLWLSECSPNRPLGTPSKIDYTIRTHRRATSPYPKRMPQTNHPPAPSPLAQNTPRQPTKIPQEQRSKPPRTRHDSFSTASSISSSKQAVYMRRHLLRCRDIRTDRAANECHRPPFIPLTWFSKHELRFRWLAHRISQFQSKIIQNTDCRGAALLRPSLARSSPD